MLARFRVTAAIGAGGMGEVYRATDTKLGREVAIKVLPAEVARDKERLARFEREAKLLASLNHPGIAHVYGFESATLEDGSSAHFLAMELVPGEDLAERLKHGAVPVDEAIEIAKQIAEALDEAHEKGIVHRDLKPANVKLTPDGQVKVLDFGLAKAYAGDAASGSSADLSQSPTLAHTGTQAGVILGTAAYMSPEQARGKPVDKRADIWAFGVVLFEMLSGTRLFAGETVSDTLAAVLREEVPWARLPADTPPAAVRTLRRCLNRDPKRRLHSAADARLEMEEASSEPGADSRVPREAKAAVASRIPWVVAGLLALALAGALSRGLLVSAPEAAVTRLKVELAPKAPLARFVGPNAVLSPDGRAVAFVTGPPGQLKIHVRQLDALEATPLSGTDEGRSPFFSPDGRWIGFATPTRLMKIGLSGGAPVTIAEVGANPGRGATWSGNQIVFTRVNTGLFKVPDSGGDPVPLTTLDPARDERSHRWPSFVPGGKLVLFMVQHTGQDYDDADIEAVSLADGRRTVLVRGGAFPRVTPGGVLLLVRDHVLYALRFDAERLRVEEPATPVLQGLLGWTGDESTGDGSAEYSLSERGDLLYRAGEGADTDAGTDFVWVDAAGRETPAFHESIYASSLAVSPDGGRVAMEGRSSRGPGVFIKDLERGTLTPLTTEGAGESSPAWSPDGKRLAYMPRRSAASLVKVRTLEGSAPELELAAPHNSGAGPKSWTGDGRALVVGLFWPQTLNDLSLLPLDGGDLRPLVNSPGLEEQGQVSPNGRWLAYESDEKGALQVFVTSLEAPGPKFQVSVRGGGSPRWSRDGRLLYFLQTDAPTRGGPIFAAPVNEGGDRLRFGTPRLIPASPRVPAGGYDAHPDGRLLVVKRQAADAADIDTAHAILVTGWREELAHRIRGNAK